MSRVGMLGESVKLSLPCTVAGVTAKADSEYCESLHLKECVDCVLVVQKEEGVEDWDWRRGRNGLVSADGGGRDLGIMEGRIMTE